MSSRAMKKQKKTDPPKGNIDSFFIKVTKKLPLHGEDIASSFLYAITVE